MDLSADRVVGLDNKRDNDVDYNEGYGEVKHGKENLGPARTDQFAKSFGKLVPVIWHKQAEQSHDWPIKIVEVQVNVERTSSSLLYQIGNWVENFATEKKLSKDLELKCEQIEGQ